MTTPSQYAYELVVKTTETNGDESIYNKFFSNIPSLVEYVSKVYGFTNNEILLGKKYKIKNHILCVAENSKKE